MRRVSVPVGTFVAFKAAPGDDEAALVADAGSDKHWSAVYPQLSIPVAVSYLSNQWERGADSACILAMTTAAPMDLIVCTEAWFHDADVPGDAKAGLLTAALEVVGVVVAPGVPAMAGVGAAGCFLLVPDSSADDYELIVPHSLTSKFSYDVLATMRPSPTIPCTTGSCHTSDGVPVPPRVAREPKDLGEFLADRVPHHTDDFIKLAAVTTNTKK